MFGLSRFPRLGFSLATACLAIVTFQAGCTCGSGPYQGDYYDGDRPPPIKKVNFIESEKGDPKVIGCADGQREGFADVKKFQRIAGCVGVWDKAQSLRAQPTGKACGDDGAKCAVPADVCAEGWHVCGNRGQIEDIRSRVQQAECDNAGPGRFNAAVSHMPNDEIDPCPKYKATGMPCMEAGLGSESVCCGNDCLFGQCKAGVWPGKTRISRGTDEGCGGVTSDRNGGVLCCYDGEEPPQPAEEAKAEAGEAAAGATAGAAEEGQPEAGAEDEGKAEGDAKAEAPAKGDDAKEQKSPKERKAPAKAGDGKSAADAKAPSDTAE